MQQINNNRAIAIVRVSTAEQAQEERFSIPHQKSHILEECRLRNLDMVHFFEFVQSGADEVFEMVSPTEWTRI